MKSSAPCSPANWPAAEAIASRLLLERPKDFWNLLKLQQVFRSDRNPSFREILKVIFGLLPAVPTREQLAQEHFDRYVATETVDATKLREARQVFHACVLDTELCALLARGEFPAVRARDAGLYQSLKALGPAAVKQVQAYIAANVSAGDFTDAA